STATRPSRRNRGTATIVAASSTRASSKLRLPGRGVSIDRPDYRACRRARGHGECDDARTAGYPKVWNAAAERPGVRRGRSRRRRAGGSLALKQSYETVNADTISIQIIYI